jgi:hypothetical protein
MESLCREKQSDETDPGEQVEMGSTSIFHQEKGQFFSTHTRLLGSK